MCSVNGAGPTRDKLDIEFLGNRTGQSYLIQTNVYKNGTGNREMRHQLWFDPTEDFHSYSILWNSHQILWVSLLIHWFVTTIFLTSNCQRLAPYNLFLSSPHSGYNSSAQHIMPPTLYFFVNQSFRFCWLINPSNIGLKIFCWI